jgi:hypothetical protein
MNILQDSRPYLAAGILLTLSVNAQAAPLTVVNVGAPAINCVFDTTCKLTVNDTIGTIPLPGISGTARLQSRAFNGAAGAPAAGKHGHLYRVDLTNAVGVGNIPCVSVLKLNFGPVTKLAYVNGGAPGDVYVITSGGLGSIGIASADKVGNVITFTFSKPVCGGASAGKGDTSYFFGLTGATPPKAITAQMQVTGGPLISVPARVPAH